MIRLGRRLPAMRTFLEETLKDRAVTFKSVPINEQIIYYRVPQERRVESVLCRIFLCAGIAMTE